MDKTNDILLSIIILSLAIALVVLFYILMVVKKASRGIDLQQQQSLTIKDQEIKSLRLVIDALEVEREKIASNIHDEIGPLLATLKLNISKYKRDLAANKLRPEELDIGREFIDTIVVNLRTASHNLSPQFVLKYGLVQAFRNYFQAFQVPKIDFESNITNDKFISKQIATNVYRISLELINNSIKHDAPDYIQVSLNQEESLLVLTIKHNKLGMTNAVYQAKLNAGDKLGLESINSRLRIINASINFEKQEGGTEVTLIIPLI